MKKLLLVLSTCLVAGCAAPVATQSDLAQYGTPPSDEDLHAYMSTMRDVLPPTRYVSYRDKGYANSVKKAVYTGDDGKPVAGWEYDFEVATYDQIGPEQPQWSRYRAFFFNGRQIGLLDQNGRFIRNSALGQNAPAPADKP